VKGLTEKSASIADEVLSITTEGEVAAVDERAMWVWASIISGNSLGHLMTEYYAEDGSLISRIHRRSSVGLGRRQYFRPYYAPFNCDAIDRALNELARLMRDDFPIDIVVTHLMQAVTGTIDIDAVYLVLAYHAAIEGWNGLHGFDDWIDRKPWEAFAKHIRKHLIPGDLYESVGSEMKDNLRAVLPSASRTTTAWRQRNLFEALGIDVASDDARRILKIRDEILHNGYLRPRWGELTPEQRQQRLDDVERLRRLALFVLFRLTGYHGEYLDPVTFERRMLAPQSEGSITI
jgi:hypothetical protein